MYYEFYKNVINVTMIFFERVMLPYQLLKKTLTVIYYINTGIEASDREDSENIQLYSPKDT